MENLWQDLRFGVRSLRKSPGFTAVAVVALALGIGANTVLFSIVSFALLRPVPYPDPNQLIYVGEHGKSFPEMSVSVPNFDDWFAQGHELFTHFGAFRRDA